MKNKYFYLKWSRLTFVLISNGWDHKPNVINHLKSEQVRFSSRHCIWIVTSVQLGSYNEVHWY